MKFIKPRHIVQISKMADAGKGARSTEAKGKEKQKKLRELVDQEEYILRKRLPRTFPKRPNDVYISKKTNFKAQMIRCQTFLDNGNKVYIHALGAAINRAVNLALQLKANGCGSVEISTNTSTVYLTDDLEPTNDKLEYETLTRTNSAIHIKVYRPPKLKD
ncbi:ribonuclease P protein subunit p20 isoform X2 [Octopus bimaculoides]|uniref:ribonuclease P protein subunit p20 isoform X2 n=1 Tax=Octopus bimaculoides TaxID=37653 RepID=UPI0022E1EB40|nr:ribonuclease P protein subunit p20 isoform X2 [Octopus bimaculoides]